MRHEDRLREQVTWIVRSRRQQNRKRRPHLNPAVDENLTAMVTDDP
jgi:hypothetical protein